MRDWQTKKGLGALSDLPLKIGHAFVFWTKKTGKVSVWASDISAETAGEKGEEMKNDWSISSVKKRGRDKIAAGLLMTRISSSHSHTTSVELEDAANTPPPHLLFLTTQAGDAVGNFVHLQALRRRNVINSQ